MNLKFWKRKHKHKWIDEYLSHEKVYTGKETSYAKQYKIQCDKKCIVCGETKTEICGIWPFGDFVYWQSNEEFEADERWKKQIEKMEQEIKNLTGKTRA